MSNQTPNSSIFSSVSNEARAGLEFYERSEIVQDHRENGSRAQSHCRISLTNGVRLIVEKEKRMKYHQLCNIYGYAAYILHFRFVKIVLIL